MSSGSCEEKRNLIATLRRVCLFRACLVLLWLAHRYVSKELLLGSAFASVSKQTHAQGRSLPLFEGPRNKLDFVLVVLQTHRRTETQGVTKVQRAAAPCLLAARPFCLLTCSAEKGATTGTTQSSASSPTGFPVSKSTALSLSCETIPTTTPPLAHALLREPHSTPRRRPLSLAHCEVQHRPVFFVFKQNFQLALLASPPHSSAFLQLRRSRRLFLFLNTGRL